MTMAVTRGTGNLYNIDNKQFVDTVTYQLWEKPSTGHILGDWGGSFTLDQLIKPGKYIIELEDGRKGPCSIVVNTKSVSGFPAIYPCSFQGTSPLT